MNLDDIRLIEKNGEYDYFNNNHVNTRDSSYFDVKSCTRLRQFSKYSSSR